MNTEEHLRVMCGDKDFQIAVLRAKVDELQEQITSLRPVKKQKAEKVEPVLIKPSKNKRNGLELR